MKILIMVVLMMNTNIFMIHLKDYLKQPRKNLVQLQALLKEKQHLMLLVALKENIMKQIQLESNLQNGQKTLIKMAIIGKFLTTLPIRYFGSPIL